MAALIGPYFIDWTSYRTDFEREASRILGREVKVEGSATARLLPFPSVTFSDVRVAGGAPGTPSMTIARFSMDAELAPFLRGEVLIFDMRIERPHATIAVDKDGTIDWTARPAALFDARQITLENVTVTDGSVTILHGAGGRTHEITDINADLSAKSLAGPWRFDGSLVADGEPASVTMSTGVVDETGRLRLRVKAEPKDYPLTLETDGDARIDKGALRYSGDFRLGAGARGGKPSSVGTAGPETVSSGPAPYRVSGKFSFDHRRLSADSFRFETGPPDDPYSADGSAFVDLGATPRFAIKATGEQVRVDEALGKGEAAGGMALDQRVAALKKVVDGLPKPSMPGTLDITLPAIVAGDTTIRDVTLSAEPAHGGWSIKSLGATLPGRTTLEAKGFLRGGADFGFDGSLLLAVAQPSGFAAWIARDVDEAVRRLPSAGFSANVELGERKQTFHDLELILGDARFRGSVDSLEPENAEPSMQVRLEGGKLDVDGLAAFVSLFVSDKGQNRLADRDLDLEVKAGPVTAGGLAADSVDTALRLKGGMLDIDRLSIKGLAGAALSATGTVKDFPASPTGTVDASVVSADLAPLAALLAERYPGIAAFTALDTRAKRFQGLLSDARINLNASAAANGDGTTGLAVSANGSAGGSRFTLTASGSAKPGALDAARFSLDATLANDDAGPVYALIGLPALPLGLVGRTEASLSAKGTLAQGAAASLRIKGEGLDGSFDGTVRSAEGGLSAAGKAALKAGDLGPWLMTAGVSLPGMGLGLPVALEAGLDYSNGALSIAGLKGTVAGGAVSGDLKAALKNGLPRIKGKLAADTIDLDLAAAMIVGDQALLAKAGKWPAAPFLPKGAAPFAADLDLSARTLLAGSISAGDAHMRAELDPAELRVSGLSATIDEGRLGGQFDLKNNGGTGLLSGDFRLARAAIGRLLAGSGLAGRADLSASVSASGKSVEAMVASLAGSGSAAFRGLVIPGINPDAFPALLAGADRIGRDIDAARTAAFAPPIVSGAAFAAPDGEAAFTLVSGVLRVPPLRLATPKATVSADLKADLNQGTGAVTGSIDYQPGDEALVGSEPSVNFSGSGPLGAMAFSLDTQPLAQFLTQRALEREQARVEAMQASLIEKQRLRREARYYRDLDETRQRIEEEKRRAEEAARQKAEADARAKAEAEARAKAEEAPKATGGGAAEPPTPADPGTIGKPRPPAVGSAGRPQGSGFNGLPGVENPNDFPIRELLRSPR